MTAKIFHTVYEIWNPLTLECIYVGKGNTRKGRKQDHLREVFRFKEGKKVPNKFKSGVMAQIIDMGAEPVFVEIERYETEEEGLIAHYGRRILGTGSLTNFNDGGKGNFGHRMPEEAKRKIGEFSRGRKMPEAAKEKIRKAATGRKHTPEQIEKQRQKMIGRKASEETLKKKSEAAKGKAWSESRWVAQKNDPKKGRPWSENARKKMEEYYETHGKKMPEWNDNQRMKFQETHRKKQEIREKECAEYDALHRTSRMMAYELLTDIQKKNRNEYWAKKRNKDNN